ncbi:SRPBCC family protein [Falsibacillus albus]|uniref:Activator of Hsp90 ATPase homologue 1/2-like C-terminal domain-containing protein n=1 Tax=Falsibacillus albus TaxID=2478915 RepID=A0A3L7K131_9BACI|nr:SRPBCC family protein [Falsibacillus albus]RLQ94362.1 hypothetical protein D9X91_15025 [Falsibacillus albus]
MNNNTFYYATYIAATPENVWKALTSGEFTEKYFFGSKVESDWKEGSKVTYYRPSNEVDVYGTVLASEENKLLSFTWNHVDDPLEREEPTLVTFELVEMKDTVKLTLKHEKLADSDIVADTSTFYGANNGWPAIISNLKSLLETGKTLPAVEV